MRLKRLTPLAAAFAFAGLAACGGGADEGFETTEQEIVTEPGTETMEVQVPTEDTLLIERETQVDVDVDTTQIEGGEVPRAPQ